MIRALLTLVLIAIASSAAQAQDRRAAPVFGARTLETGFTPDPFSLSILVGEGEIDASVIDPACVGQISAAPSAIVRYAGSDASSLPLFISVTSLADTTLAVLAPDGRWYCDDDGGQSLNPLVTFQEPRSGRYRIWVGTFAADAGRREATLFVSEVASPSASTGEAPDFSLEPAYGAIEINAQSIVTPRRLEVSAGGSVDASSIPGCMGFVALAPDYRVQWTAGAESNTTLVFSAHAEADTVLIINDASGNWLCDDDSGGGRDPRVVIDAAPSGQYDVWVGLYSPGELQPSALTISRLEEE